MRTRLCALVILTAATVCAHVGSPDIYYEGKAGPYNLSIVIRPPQVIPGVAEIEVRSTAADLDTLRVTTLKLLGAGARYAPVPDDLHRSKDDPHFYTGSLWLMAPGSSQVRLEANGKSGSGTLAIPVPALAQRTSTMQRGLGTLLLILMVILSLGLVGIFGAAFRDSTVPPGELPTPRHHKLSRAVMAAAAIAVALILYLGNSWWNTEASSYQRSIFKPLQAETNITSDGRLALSLYDPGWLVARKTDDFLPDHGHLMHLYLVAMPMMDHAWHLHPDMTVPGIFAQNLPALNAGHYRLYGDLVHATGIPETVVADLDLPSAIAGRTLENDDAGTAGPALGQASPRAILADGTTVVWEKESNAPLVARRPTSFHFRILDAQGQPATDVVPYMGMAGHAAFLKADGSTFAHIHPTGSVPMAAVQLAGGPGDPHAGHHTMRLEPLLTFPYGFPEAGPYRIIVQFRRGEQIETAMFDANVIGVSRK